MNDIRIRPNINMRVIIPLSTNIRLLINVSLSYTIYYDVYAIIRINFMYAKQ